MENVKEKLTAFLPQARIGETTKKLCDKIALEEDRDLGWIIRKAVEKYVDEYFGNKKPG